MERYIKTKGGTTIEILACSCPNMYSGRNLFISCINITVKQLLPIITNSDEISLIHEFYLDKLVNEYSGYSVLLGMNINVGNNSIELNLSRPENEADGVWEL